MKKAISALFMSASGIIAILLLASNNVILEKEGHSIAYNMTGIGFYFFIALTIVWAILVFKPTKTALNNTGETK